MSPSQAAAGLDVGAVQAALTADGIDGWLLYDFRGLNPLAADVTGVGRQGGHLATRRWYYLIPATGEPRGLVHEIEKNSLAHLPGTSARYAGRDELEAGLRDAARPACAASRWNTRPAAPSPTSPASTPARSSSCARRASRWCPPATSSSASRPSGTRTRSPRTAQASEKLYRVKDRAFEAVAQRLRDGVATTEYDIQQLMAGWFRDEGLVSDADPNVSAGENSGNPHYLPTAARAPRDSGGRDRAARPLGQARSPRRGVC